MQCLPCCTCTRLQNQAGKEVSQTYALIAFSQPLVILKTTLFEPFWQQFD